MGLEFHMTYKYRHSKQYFTIVQELYNLGFVTIMWDENRVSSLKWRSERELFEIVFRRFNFASKIFKLSDSKTHFINGKNHYQI